ncbi:MAG: SHOCT domain-containing protein [Pseudomonadota bacterium]
MYADHMWWGGMWMIFPLLFFILLILVPLFLWQRGFPFKTPEDKSESPLEILKKRYAKGEITKDQFEQIKKDIS